MIKCPTAITEVKNDRNMTNDELKDVGIKDVVPYKRDDNVMTTVKRPIETSDVDNDFMREYDSMRKSMEDRQINDYYEAWRHIQSTMKGDTPIKTGQNRQCIDNITDYDREHNKIQRQKVSDDEDIDIDKIARGDKPKDDRNSATKTEKRYKEKEA